MIDLHCHILPGIDDGATSMEESCLMAQIAVESGVTAVAMTSHCNVPDQFDNYADTALVDQILNFRDVLRQREIPLRVYPGMEVYVTPNLSELLEEKRLLTLGLTRYLLVEFGFDESARFINQMLQVVENHGCIPMIAHPERYYCVQDDEKLLLQWASRGYPLQMNKGSFFGMFGRHAAKTAHWAFQHGCIHLIGSDAHSPYVRTPRLTDVWGYVAELSSEEIADFLLTENPKRILNDELIRPLMAEF